jgi:hypothetical protein
VEIDSHGVVTGNAAGDTTITASTGFITSLIPVHVRHINVAAVDVFPPATTMQVDDHLKFDATPYDSDGNSLIGRPHSVVQWQLRDRLRGTVFGRHHGKVCRYRESHGEQRGKEQRCNGDRQPKTDAASSGATFRHDANAGSRASVHAHCLTPFRNDTSPNQCRV